MSLEVASRLFDWSSIALAIGACIVFVATAAIVWLGIIKEHHWDLLREHANEKIVSVELEAAKSNAEAAKAHERIAELSTQAEELRKGTAEANARAAEAKLALEKFRAPRLLLPEQRADIASKMQRWAIIPKSGESQSVAVFAADPSFEAAQLADHIAVALGPAGAKWKVNRNHVAYGLTYALSGVGILSSSNPRGKAVAESLAEALNSVGTLAFVIPEKRSGCEEMGEPYKERADSDPWCSSISVIVGEHPR